MKESLAQIFHSGGEKYLDYDFEARKARRDPKLVVEVASANLGDLSYIMQDHGIRLIVLFGTALGATRGENLIEYDTDIDTGILSHDVPKLKGALSDIKEAGFDLIRSKHPDDLLTFMRNDEYIDIGILRLFTKYGKEYIGYQNHEIPKRFFLNLEKVKIGQNEYLAPSPVQEYLNLTYGSDWRKERRNEPAMNTGLFNIFIRLRRSFIRTRIGSQFKKLKHKLRI